jgi:hypothetical protein
MTPPALSSPGPDLLAIRRPAHVSVRVAGMLSALVAAGIEAGYLTNPRLAKVHWQAAGRRLPAPQVIVAGESALWVDTAEIPADGDVDRLGKALNRGRRGHLHELMANTAAYSGLRWGELTALTIGQVETVTRVITVDRKVVEVAGHLYIEAPKSRRTASPAGRSTRAARPPTTRSPRSSPPASRPPAPSRTPGSTPSA